MDSELTGLIYYLDRVVNWVSGLNLCDFLSSMLLGTIVVAPLSLAGVAISLPLKRIEKKYIVMANMGLQIIFCCVILFFVIVIKPSSYSTGILDILTISITLILIADRASEKYKNSKGKKICDIAIVLSYTYLAVAVFYITIVDYLSDKDFGFSGFAFAFSFILVLIQFIFDKVLQEEKIVKIGILMWQKFKSFIKSVFSFNTIESFGVWMIVWVGVLVHDIYIKEYNHSRFIFIVHIFFMILFMGNFIKRRVAYLKQRNDNNQ